MILPDVLYDNAFRDATPSYSGTITTGFEAVNAVDWRDFTKFRPSVGTTTFDVTCPANHAIDSFAFWAKMNVDASCTFLLQYESSVGVYTTLGSSISRNDLVANPMIFQTFAAVTVLAGRKIRLSCTVATTGDWDIRQVTAGTRLTFETGQWAGLSPSRLQQGVVAENVIAQNGSIIARNLRRLEKQGKISLQYLTASWVRTYWNPFAVHASRYPFWFRHNPTDYATESAFAAASEINAPVNAMPTPRMSVDMPIRYLTP